MKHLSEFHIKEYNKITKKKDEKHFQNIANSLVRTGSSINPKLDKVAEAKTAHGLKLALLSAECYIAPRVFSTAGFHRFMESYGVKTSNFPKERNVLETSLDKLYLLARHAVEDYVKKNCPKLACCISTDAWTDSHQGMSYLNYNLIFYNTTKNQLETILLETAPFGKSKTGENLLNDLKRVLNDFGILDRKIGIVYDGAANNHKMYKLSFHDNEIQIIIEIVCICHNIHNLLFTDVFKGDHFSDLDLKSLNSKMIRIHHKLHFRKNELKNMTQKKQSEENWDRILTHLQMDDDYVLEDYIPNPSIGSLKTNNNTRWMSTLSMIKSFLPLVDHINDILYQDKRSIGFILTENDVGILNDLNKIYSIFEEATLIFQVSI